MKERKIETNNIYYAIHKGEGENKKLNTTKPLVNVLITNYNKRRKQDVNTRK